MDAVAAQHPAQLDGPVAAALRELLDATREHDGGAVSDDIAELEAVDPEQLGIALVSIDGRRYAAGDGEAPFTIQSIAKALVFALALEDHGAGGVLEHVGVEPSGEAFDAISLHPESGRPPNPMVNAGALVTTSLIEADHPADRFARIRRCLSAFAGRELGVDEAVYRAQVEGSHRNRGLAHLLRHHGTLRADVEEVIDVYSRQCAITVTAGDLAVIGATLAAHGVNPVTGERVVSAGTARDTLSTMASCGMYDASGRWLFDVGMPAKSGIGGGVLAVSPGGFGVGVFSPRLDEVGNSVRGVAAVRELSRRFDLHLLDRPGQVAPVIGVDERHLTGGGEEVVVLAAQGELEFIEAERLIWAITQAAPARLILDLTAVTQVHAAGGELLDARLRQLVDDGVRVTLVHDAHVHGRLTASDHAASREAAVAALG